MENGIVFIGKKPIMSYVLAVLMHLNSGNDSVVIKARGMSISKAVDVSQVIKRKMSQGIKVSNVEVGTDEIQEKDSTWKNVSFISIELKRQI